MTDSRQRRTEVVKEGKEDCGVAQTREEDVGRKSSPEGGSAQTSLSGRHPSWKSMSCPIDTARM